MPVTGPSARIVLMLLRTSFIIILLSLLSLPFRPGYGQSVRLPETSGLGYPELLELLERQHEVHFYFKTEWFRDRKADPSLLTLPPAEAAGRIAAINNLSIVVMDSTSYIFLPNDAPPPQVKGPASLMVVGNPSESGKYSTATLSGTITDGTTGLPLPGAIVMAGNRKAHSVTGREGKYSLTLPVGEHQLSIQFVGYEELRQSVRIVSNGQADFQVFEKSLQLQTVVITDERLDMNLSHTRMSTIRLDAKAIKELPTSLGETDIIRSVTLMPGVQSVGEFGSGFIVRGGNADQNLILLEDVPLFNSSHLFGLNSVVNPDVVNSVTLFKAGIPARYGERASSVMSIRMSPATIKSVKVKGGLGILNSRLGIETPIGKNASLLISGRSSYSDWLLHSIHDVDLKNSTAGFYDLSGLLQAGAGKNDKFTLFGYYSSDRFSFTSTTRYNYSNLMGSFRWNHIFNKNLSSNLLAGTSRYQFGMLESDSLLKYDASHIRTGIRYETLKWSLNWFPGEKHSVEFGLAGILYRNDPGELLPDGAESLVQEVILQKEKGLEMAAYLSDDFTVTPWLNAEAGIRAVRYSLLGPGQQILYENGIPGVDAVVTDTLFYGNNRSIVTYNALEPRLSLRFRIDEQKSVKLSYTRMNQFLNLVSNTSVISPTDTWKLSDPYFRPLGSDQYALGYFHNLNDNKIETSVEVYYKQYRHVPEYRNGAQVLLNQQLEAELLDSKAGGYGLELFLNKNSGRLTGWFSYTWSRSLHRTQGSSETDQINRNEWFPSNYDIPHQLVMNLNYHISRRWRFSSTFTWHSGKPVTLPELKYMVNGYQLILYSDRNKYRLPDYHRLDIALTYDQSLSLRKKWKGSWTLSVVNLYGRKNAFSAYYAREDSRTWKYTGAYHLYTLYILGVPLPTLTYNFTF